MKKIIKISAVALAVIMLFTSLTACDLFDKKLKGKYEADGILGIGTSTFEFSGSKVKYSYTIAGRSVSQEGTYKIEDDIITFEWFDENGDAIEDAKFSGEYKFEEKKNGDIIIGTTEYEITD